MSGVKTLLYLKFITIKPKFCLTVEKRKSGIGKIKSGWWKTTNQVKFSMGIIIGFVTVITYCILFPWYSQLTIFVWCREKEFVPEWIIPRGEIEFKIEYKTLNINMDFEIHIFIYRNLSLWASHFHFEDLKEQLWNMYISIFYKSPFWDDPNNLR